MGSKPRDSGTMSSASSGAQASDAALAAQATQNTAYAKQAHDILFGADGKSGNLSKFLDPTSLDVSGPTGTYGLQYKQAVGNIAKQSQDVRGSISRYNANRGFGSNAPAGFTEDQQRRAAEGQVSQQGAAFTDYAGKSYQDALQNFWNASNIATGSGAAATNAAISADSAAANNYANLYGTASQPRPSALGGIIGSGLQAGGAVGAAAMCHCEDSRILMHDGTEKFVQDLRKGMDLRGIDGRACPLLEDPRVVVRQAVKVATLHSSTRVSVEHTFALPLGGYEFAFKSRALNVRFKEEIATVLEVEEIGPQPVYVLEIGGSHSYRGDGFWALS
jgi:hypothetical protein